MKKLIAGTIIAGTLAGVTVQQYKAALPDPVLTPGVVDARVTQDVLCGPHYTTRSVRPAASYTNALKRKQMQERQMRGLPRDYEEDHEISLELGGHPTDPKNLWPEPYAGLVGAHQKDQVENYLHKAVCSGEMTLEEAQAAIRTDWVKVYLTQFFKLDHHVTEETKP